MPPFVRLRFALCAAVVLAAACSDNSIAPSSPSVPDVATLLAEMSPSGLSSVASLASPVVGASLQTAGVPDPNRCPYSSSSGFFVCPTTTANGLTFTEMFRLIDAAGNSQSAPDAQTTAIETKSTVTGTVTSAANTYHVDGSSDQTLSGIRTNSHTLNGTSSTHVTGQEQVGTLSVPIDQTVTETMANLVLPNTKAGQKWPQSGSLTVHVSNNASVTNFGDEINVVITFNGSSTATVTFTDYFGTRTCTVDMANPNFSGCLA